MRRGDIVIFADRSGGDFATKPRPAVIIQSDDFSTASVTLCPLTSRDDLGSPLLRIPVLPDDTNALHTPSWLAVERITSVRRSKVRLTSGRITPEQLYTLQRHLAVFLGFG